MNDLNTSDQKKKKYRERIKDFYNNPSVDYRHKAFILFSMTVLIALFVAIPCGIIMHEPLTATLSTLVGALFFLVYVYYSIKKDKIEQAKIVISVILVFIFLPGMFFTNGGAEGGTPVWLLLGAIFISMILEGRFKRIMLLLNACVSIVTWTIGYYYPELIVSYSRGGNYFDSIAALLIVSIIIYMLFGLNNKMEQVRANEIQSIQGEQKRMKRLFEQTATAFVSAVEKKDIYVKGNAERVAGYAKRIAEACGKDEQECERIYYAAMLHDVGLIGIPDSVINNENNPSKQDYEMIRQKPLIGSEILSSISEYPYLGEGARYSHERYNGTGYPDGLKGEEIPEIARIIAVADAYVDMTSKKPYREASPGFVARETLVKGSGEEFDPVFSEIMLKIIDEDSREGWKEDALTVETELSCGEYRSCISGGIPVERNITRVSFDYAPSKDEEHVFSTAAVILFDSYDRRVHDNGKSIEAYKYVEYGELWFDEHSITTEARRIEETVNKRKEFADRGEERGKYEIIMGRYEDHLKLRMRNPSYEKEVIVALPNRTVSSYIAVTGEYCSITNIVIEKTEELMEADDIKRIVDEISYTGRMESDIKNIQIDRARSASTEGIKIKDRLKIEFHAMSLPSASLVWHCPYILLFYSDDGRVDGENYKKYAEVKLYGENDGSNEYAVNSISVKKNEGFPGWDKWKEANKAGIECEVTIRHKEGRIILKTRNLGIEVENITTINNYTGEVYVALTGDQVAITDIRVR
jgi:hypothetical protein